MHSNYNSADHTRELIYDGSVTNLIELLSKVVKALGMMFGEKCEVVLHDLRNPESSIVAIVNGHLTGRKIGGPIIGGPLKDKGLKEILKKAEHTDIVANYSTQTRDGKTLRSTSILFRNKKDEPILALCINMDFTELQLARDILTSWCSGETTEEFTNDQDDDKDINPNDINKMIKSIVDESIATVGKPLALMEKEDKLKAIISMNEKGLFLIKGSIDYAARSLGVTRYTIYNYLKEIKHYE